MKKILYVLSALPGALLAQPTIPASDVPNPGSSLAYCHLDDTPTITPGADQVWFIGGTVNYYDSFDFMPTSLAPGGSNFPTATIAFSDAAQEFYGFFAFAGADLNYLGFFDNNNTADYHFTNPWTYMKYPCSMGTQWTDTYAFENGPLQTISYVADGYGTLIGPGGFLENVLKVRSTEVWSDTIINGVHLQTVDISDRFWRPGEAFHVGFVLKTENRVDGLVVNENYSVELKSSLAVGMEENQADAIGVQARPNPATDQVTLTFGAQGAVRIEVIDALGQVMGTPVQRTVAPGVSSEELNVQGWPAGQYCARITMANGDQGSVRFIVH